MYTMYILESLKNGRFYYGHTKDLNKRLEEHNNGVTPSTKHLAPFKLIYFEKYPTKAEAQKREHYFKSLKNKKYIIWMIERSKSKDFSSKG